MTITPLWSDELLSSYLPLLEEKQFWFYSDKGTLLIDKTELFRKFCPAIGIHNIPMDADDKGKRTLTTVFVSGNRVEPVSCDDIQDIIERLLELWDEQTGGSAAADIIVKLGTTEPFDKKGMRLISKRKDIKMLRDTATTAYQFFRNGWVSITSDGTSPLKQYSELSTDKFVWNSSIVRRDWVTHSSMSDALDLIINEGKHPETGEYLDTSRKKTSAHKKYKQKYDEEEQTPVETHFLDFLRNLAKDDEGNVCEKNLRRIQLSIGYLSHRYQQPDQRKWVLFVDRNIDSGSRARANGGNGKSILVEALKNYLNTAEADGREYVKGSSSNRFAFSNVTPATDMVFFDDAAQDFDLKSLYSRTTGSFTVNKKHRDSFVIPCADAPKMVITSNYAIADDDPSTQRRNYQVEVSDFYKSQREEYGWDIKDFHGQKLIAQEGGGWNDQDWTHFYSVVADCVALYLRDGLPTQSEESDTFKRNRLCSLFTVENPEALLDHFIRELNAAVESGQEVFVEHFYRTTRELFVFPEQTTNTTLWEWLKAVGKAFGMNPNQHYRNGNQQQQRLVGERLERWKDAGMSDWVDKNGNNPLDLPDDKRKCYVFKVSSLKNPTTVGSQPDFISKKGSDEKTNLSV